MSERMNKEKSKKNIIKNILDHSSFSTEYVFADILLQHHWGQLDLDEAIELMYDRMIKELEEVFEDEKELEILNGIYVDD